MTADPRGLIELIARALVSRPDCVEANLVSGTGASTRVVELKVAKSDLGKVIGRQGRTAWAMRMLLGACSAGEGGKTLLEILEDEGADPGAPDHSGEGG